MRNDLEDYLSELRTRNYSESRLLHVGRAVSQLMLYLEDAHQVNDWMEVKLSHLQGFTVFASTRYRTPKGRLIAVNSLRQWLSCIRVFFAWMNLRGRLPYDPAEALRLPQAVASLPRVLSVRAMKRLIEMPDIGTAIGVRDRALMETLYATGIRHLEVYRLNVFDVELDDGFLLVRQGKGRRDRFVPLTETAVYWLCQYISTARPQLAEMMDQSNGQPCRLNSPLWLSNRGRRLSYQMIGERVGEYAARTKVKATIHSFRHACATHLLQGGAGTRYIQRLLGHQSIETTELYTHVEIKDLKRAVKKAFRQLEKSESRNSPELRKC